MEVLPLGPWSPIETLREALTFLHDEQAAQPLAHRASVIAHLNVALCDAERANPLNRAA